MPNSASLNKIVNKAEDELGLTRSTGLNGSMDGQARQMLALMNSLGDELLDRHEWSGLTQLATLTTVAGQSDYDLPTDYRSMFDRTVWDATRHWQIAGPISPAVATALKQGGSIGIGLDRFRIIGNKIRLWPTPTKSGQTVVYEYKSASWVRNASTGDAVGSEYQDDTNVTIYRTNVLVAGLKAKYMMAKGFNSPDLFSFFEQAILKAISDDVGLREISFARSRGYDDLDCLGGLTIVLPGA